MFQHGSYYVYSDAYTDPVATSNSSQVSYVANRHVRRTFIDGGRTRMVSQDFDISVDNRFRDSVTVNAYYYFNKTTGVVTSNSY